MSIKMNKGNSYPPIKRDLDGSDRLIASQSGYKTPTGFKTGLVTMPNLSSFIFTTLENDIKNMVYLDDKIFVGEGTVDNPISFNNDWLRANFVNAGMTNISQVGDLRAAALNITISEDHVRIIDRIPFLLSGITGYIEPQVVSPPSTSGNYKFFVYLTLEARQPKVVVDTTAKVERIDFTLLATITVTNGKLTNIYAPPIIRLDRYRISDKRCGSALLSASGPAAQYNFTNWE